MNTDQLTSEEGQRKVKNKDTAIDKQLYMETKREKKEKRCAVFSRSDRRWKEEKGCLARSRINEQLQRADRIRND